MTVWTYYDEYAELPADLDDALKRAQQALGASAAQHIIHAGGMSTYPTKMMQNTPTPDKKTLDEEAAETKRIDEMTLADYQRAIRKLDRKPWDEKA